MSRSTIEAFYTAFQKLDGAAMAACYAPQARFQDPVFTLQGRERVGGMWQMLTQATQAKGRDVWRLEYGNVAADAAQGSAHWEAHYRFSTTGRMVHNIIDASFRFDAGGLIAEHVDRFDFWRWSRQALGAPGWLMGWTPLLQNKIRARAAAGLDKFLASQGG
jgi:ketosteroid isomerase-like protein